MKARPPADKVQQIVSVKTETFIRQAPRVLTVQIAIDPTNLDAGNFFDYAKRTLSFAGGALADYMEIHG
jgi:hypothetical protein